MVEKSTIDKIEYNVRRYVDNNEHKYRNQIDA